MDDDRWLEERRNGVIMGLSFTSFCPCTEGQAYIDCLLQANVDCLPLLGSCTQSQWLCHKEKGGYTPWSRFIFQSSYDLFHFR